MANSDFVDSDDNELAIVREARRRDMARLTSGGLPDLLDKSIMADAWGVRRGSGCDDLIASADDSGT